MKLNQIFLNRETYGVNIDKLIGTATFEGKAGEVKLAINAEAAQAILALCASGVIAAAREVALNLTTETITDSGRLLEHEGFVVSEGDNRYS